MKTIYFKNGSITQVTIDIAKILRDRINEGCNNFQVFSEGDEPILFINVSEIVYIR